MILKASLCLQYHRANSVLWFLTHLTKHQKTGLNCLGHKDHSVIVHRYSPRNQMHHIPLLWVKGPAFFAWLCSGWENLFQGTPGPQSLTSVWPSAVTLWICLRIHLGKILIFNFSVSFPPHMLQVKRNEYPCCLAKQQHWIRHMLRGTDVYWEACEEAQQVEKNQESVCNSCSPLGFEGTEKLLVVIPNCEGVRWEKSKGAFIPSCFGVAGDVGVSNSATLKQSMSEDGWRLSIVLLPQ